MLTTVSPTSTGRTPGVATQRAMFNRDEFLKILTSEISHQNPLDPMSNEDFLGQLAQLQQLETSAGLSDTLTNLLKFQEIGAASGLLGRAVRAVSDEGEPVMGVVDRVVVDGAQVRLIVGGRPAALANIREIVS